MASKADIKKKRQTHKVMNWPSYTQSMKNRGDLQILLSTDLEDIWYEENNINDGTGKPRDYTDKCIMICYELKLFFKKPLRQLEGLINSLFKMSSINLHCPDYTTLSKRLARLDIKMPKYTKSEKKQCVEGVLAIDSTGLKQFGRDEWHQEKHNVDGKRTWKKLHIGVDEDHIIQAVTLTHKDTQDFEAVPDLLNQTQCKTDRYVADGAYDRNEVYRVISEHKDAAKVIVPPRKGAVSSDKSHAERNKNVDIVDKLGFKAWCKIRKYGWQNYSELAMWRYKKIIGNTLHSREFSRQKNEVMIGAYLLNKFSRIGMPISQKIS